MAGEQGDTHAARTAIEKRGGLALSPSLCLSVTLKRYKLLHMHCIRV